MLVDAPRLLHAALHIRQAYDKRAMLEYVLSSGIDLAEIYRAMHILDIAEDPVSVVVKAYAMAGWLEGWLLIDARIPPLDVLAQMYRDEAPLGR